MQRKTRETLHGEKKKHCLGCRLLSERFLKRQASPDNVKTHVYLGNKVYKVNKRNDFL